MGNPQQPAAGFFTQVDVSPGAEASEGASSAGAELTEVLHQILAAQDRQNELLEQLVSQLTLAQRQRNNELNQWKQSNPRLAARCRRAAETLSRVQAEFLETLTEEVEATSEALMDGEFMLSEFVDRFGPRLAHLNGVLQVLTQLSAGPQTTSPPNPS